jgi:glycosyltransferase involved in cell wall biosynthesis
MKERLKIMHIIPDGIQNSKLNRDIGKVIWNYKINLEKKGHIFDIGYPWEIKKDYDIIHCHKSNQCINLYESGKKYIFSIHNQDISKKDNFNRILVSPSFIQNYNSMKKSIISISHSDFINNYFNGINKLFYLSNGVDINLYKDYNIINNDHKILCIDSNELSDNLLEDTKYFKLCIESAKKLNLSITIVSSKINKCSFDDDLLNYDKLTIINDLNDIEIINLYNTHTIFLYLSKFDSSYPNLNVLESLSCGIPVISNESGLDGVIKCELDVDNIVYQITDVINDYDKFKNNTKKIRDKYDWSIISNRLEQFYYNVMDIKTDITSETMKNKIVDIYENTNKSLKYLEPKTDFLIDFHYGVKLTIKSSSDKNLTFQVKFIDKDTNTIWYDTTIGINQWSKPNRSKYTNWNINILNVDTKEIYNIDFDSNNKNIFIKIDNIEYEEVEKIIEKIKILFNQSIVYCKTIFNDKLSLLFSDINFVDELNDELIYASYDIKNMNDLID